MPGPWRPSEILDSCQVSVSTEHAPVCRKKLEKRQELKGELKYRYKEEQRRDEYVRQMEKSVQNR
jgi:hypothetical protein